ncbi:MAG: endo-1,4-beta-xylanase [archaeon]|nr:endo-1,4-beta-xylanase [archaeon]
MHTIGVKGSFAVLLAAGALFVVLFSVQASMAQEKNADALLTIHAARENDLKTENYLRALDKATSKAYYDSVNPTDCSGTLTQSALELEFTSTTNSFNLKASPITCAYTINLVGGTGEATGTIECAATTGKTSITGTRQFIYNKIAQTQTPDPANPAATECVILDEISNMKEQPLAEIIVDEPPVVSLDADPPTGTSPHTVTFTLQCSDEGTSGTCTIYFDDEVAIQGEGLASEKTFTGAAAWGTHTITTTYNTPGNFTVRAEATDSSGNTSISTEQINVSAASNSPTASISTSPQIGAPQTIAFTAVCENSNQCSLAVTGPSTYNFNFPSPTGGQTSHEFTEQGEYTATLTATGEAGAATNTAQFTLTSPTAPTATLTANPEEGPDPLTVTFNATCTDDVQITQCNLNVTDTDGTTVYTHDFSPGEESTTNQFSAGNYTGTLTATDNEGATNTASVQITVLEATAPQLKGYKYNGTTWQAITATEEPNIDRVNDWLKGIERYDFSLGTDRWQNGTHIWNGTKLLLKEAGNAKQYALDSDELDGISTPIDPDTAVYWQFDNLIGIPNAKGIILTKGNQLYYTNANTPEGINLWRNIGSTVQFNADISPDISYYYNLGVGKKGLTFWDGTDSYTLSEGCITPPISACYVKKTATELLGASAAGFDPDLAYIEGGAVYLWDMPDPSTFTTGCNDDGYISGSETCDGATFIEGTSCATEKADPYSTGAPSCSASCTINTSACTSPVTLKELAALRGLKVGTEVPDHYFQTLSHDLAYRATFEQQYSAMAIGELFVNLIQPTEGNFDLSPADAMLNFASEKNITDIYGMHLVWHGSLPSWLINGFKDDSLDATHIEQIMKNDIRELATYFREKNPAASIRWSVVNEAISNCQTSTPGTYNLRTYNTCAADNDVAEPNVWSRAPNYIEKAFAEAKATDPNAILFLNEYNIEGGSAAKEKKYKAFKALVQDLQSKGVPIDAVGFQMHVFDSFDGSNPPTKTELKQKFAEMAALGLDVYITELDVWIRTSDGVSDAELNRQAQIYMDVIGACLESTNCKGINTWGFTDRASWVPWAQPNYGAALPFDEYFEKKPAYDAIISELQNA